MPGYVFGRLGRLHRERLHLRSHDRKPSSRRAGPRRLDRGVKRKQVGLAGDALNKLDHVVDFLRRPRERSDFLVGRLRLGGDTTHHVRGTGQLAIDFGNRFG